MEQAPLEVEVVNEGSRRRVVATGELDLAGSPALDAALVAVAEEQVTELVLDLRGVTFIDSSGIRCVLDAYNRARAHGADMQIFSGLEAGVVFGLAGLTNRLPFVA
ncbi:MAG: hypothetical protein QOF77_1995 [Solirubrobacteraceae bacterium]|jgi:anti-anti-sigma factor|nr:hypothetical protein [Solirubrobacteraceae bacterium]